MEDMEVSNILRNNFEVKKTVIFIDIYGLNTQKVY